MLLYTMLAHAMPIVLVLVGISLDPVLLAVEPAAANTTSVTVGDS